LTNTVGTDRLSLVPYPKSVVCIEGRFDLAKAVLVYDVYDAGAAEMAEHIRIRCVEASGSSPQMAVKGASFPLLVDYEWNDSLVEEGYRLTVTPNRALITASTKRGRWYGAMTLCQLIGEDGSVPCVDIEDAPDFRIRAVSDDISRGQVSTLDHFKRIIRFCSEYKINTYFLYIEDLFQFRTNRRIGVGRGGLTVEEIKELSIYARSHHVDLAPLFESLGHQDRMVTMPEYAEFREGEGSFSFTPADPRTLRLMEDFYRELADAFSSAILFAGLDETTDIGSGRSKEALEKHGHAKIYADYYNGLNRIAKKLGKQLWIYATLSIDYPESLELMDKDIVMVNYTFSAPDSGDAWWDNLYTYLPLLIEKGFTEVVSPSIINWKRMYPDYTWAYEHSAALNKIGFDNGCVGSMTASWADDGGENFREYNWYGYALQAELSWNAGTPVKQEAFAPRFGDSYFGPGLSHLGTALMHLGQVEAETDGTFHILYGPATLKEKYDEKKLDKMKQAGRHWSAFMRKWYRDGKAPSVRRNAEFLPYVDFAARRVRFTLDLPERSNRILDWTRSYGERGKLERELAELYETMLQFRAEFQALWRRACRIEGLDYNLARMDEFLRGVRDLQLAVRGGGTECRNERLFV
jgi:hypothetical protein